MFLFPGSDSSQSSQIHDSPSTPANAVAGKKNLTPPVRGPYLQNAHKVPSTIHRPYSASSPPVLSTTSSVSGPVRDLEMATRDGKLPQKLAITENPLKKFVLPTWARTNTVTLPRLSEEAQARQREVQEKKTKEAEERRQEARERRRKGRVRTVTTFNKERAHSRESSDDSDGLRHRSGQIHSHPNRSNTTARKEIGISSLPVFASDAIVPVPSSPPKSHLHARPPATPPRKRHAGAHHTPEKAGSSKGNKTSPANGTNLPQTPSGAGTLFTPGTGSGSLFTPSTPTAAARYTHTVRSPIHHRTVMRTPRRSVGQVPRTPTRRTPRLTLRTPGTGDGPGGPLGKSASRKSLPESGSSSPTSCAHAT